MSNRPYSTYSVHDLENLAEEFRHDIKKLRLLSDEAAHRTSLSATALQMSLSRKIRIIEITQSKGKERNQEDTSRYEAAKPKTPPTEIELLRAALSKAQEEIVSLKRELIKHSQPRQEMLFRRVGLHPSAPEFVIRAVRTAYRKALHPDSQPSAHKSAAHVRFIEAEDLFAQIFQTRKFK